MTQSYLFSSKLEYLRCLLSHYIFLKRIHKFLKNFEKFKASKGLAFRLYTPPKNQKFIFEKFRDVHMFAVSLYILKKFKIFY